MKKHGSHDSRTIPYRTPRWRTRTMRKENYVTNLSPAHSAKAFKQQVSVVEILVQLQIEQQVGNLELALDTNRTTYYMPKVKGLLAFLFTAEREISPSLSGPSFS